MLTPSEIRTWPTLLDIGISKMNISFIVKQAKAAQCCVASKAILDNGYRRLMIMITIIIKIKI